MRNTQSHTHTTGGDQHCCPANHQPHLQQQHSQHPHPTQRSQLAEGEGSQHACDQWERLGGFVSKGELGDVQ